MASKFIELRFDHDKNAARLIAFEDYTTKAFNNLEENLIKLTNAISEKIEKRIMLRNSEIVQV